jgi:proteasome lid subunit RPN8/RPN11
MTSASTSSEPISKGLAGRLAGIALEGGSHVPAWSPTQPAAPSSPMLDGLAERPFPGLDDGYRLHGERPEPSQALVLVSQGALRLIQDHGASSLSTELGGALLGRAYQCEGRLIVEVEAALPVVTEDHGPVHLTFTADTWAQLHRDRSIQHPELAIVGWFHTHPNLGVFFSADDVIVHSAAFVLPWHVALVVDPALGEACFFAWDSGRPNRKGMVPLAGFYERLDSQPESVVPWRVAHRPGWTEAAQVIRQAGRLFVPPSEWLSLPPISPWWGVLLGGLSLLISLFLLLERLFR